MHNQRIKNGGFGFCTTEVMRDATLSIRDKAVYAYLCTFADSKTNELTVSVNTIASELNIAPVTVSRSLKILESRFIIQRNNRGLRKSKLTVVLK